MLGPDTGVEDADDLPLACVVRAAGLVPDRRRADPRDRLVVGLAQRVLLDRHDAVDLQQVRDLIRRHDRRDAAVHRLERLLHVGARNGALDCLVDLVAHGRGVGLVRVDRALVGLQLLARLARARRCETCHAAVVGRRGVVVVLDDHVDRRAVGTPEQRRIGLCESRDIRLRALDRVVGYERRRRQVRRVHRAALSRTTGCNDAECKQHCEHDGTGQPSPKLRPQVSSPSIVVPAGPLSYALPVGAHCLAPPTKVQEFDIRVRSVT